MNMSNRDSASSSSVMRKVSSSIASSSSLSAAVAQGGLTGSIRNLTLNQDYDYFSTPTDVGFNVYSLYHYKQVTSRDIGYPMKFAVMLNKTNLIALVGLNKEIIMNNNQNENRKEKDENWMKSNESDGKSSNDDRYVGGYNDDVVDDDEDDDRRRFTSNKIVLWDDSTLRCVAELSFDSTVTGVKMSQKKILAITETYTYVFNFELEMIKKIQTCLNLSGAGSVVNVNQEKTIVAALSEKVGQVVVYHYSDDRVEAIYPIAAHDSNVHILALSRDGKYLATVSGKGTTIKIFSTKGGEQIIKFHRGNEEVKIFSLAFSYNSEFLVCSSSSETVHVFKVPQINEPLDQKTNARGSSLSSNNNISGNISSSASSTSSSKNSFADFYGYFTGSNPTSVIQFIIPNGLPTFCIFHNDTIASSTDQVDGTKLPCYLSLISNNGRFWRVSVRDGYGKVELTESESQQIELVKN